MKFCRPVRMLIADSLEAKRRFFSAMEQPGSSLGS